MIILNYRLPLVALLASLFLNQNAMAQDWQYTQIVDIDFVAEYAVIPKRNDVVIVDSRPRARKYDKGHIPTAISLPDSQFDVDSKLLPEQKDTLIIFYCGGMACKLSHQSAYKAEKLGYQNIRVYAAGYPEWIKQGHFGAVSLAYVQKQLGKGAKMVLVDARPERKFKKGSITGAINIPATKYAQHSSKLPSDKNASLVFFCGGYACQLSEKAAKLAREAGYTKIKTFPAGHPAWAKAQSASKAGGAGDSGPVIAQGEDEGTISIASLQKILKTNPESILLVDVRDAKTFSTNSLPTAINIPIDVLAAEINKLPTDKPIIFFCNSGGMSGEAYDMVKMLRSGLINVYFLDALVTYNRDQSYKIEAI